ncbi:hypothetical protein DL96DRAFT_1710202 [Flagelloscypha sp. PMI_526]|nr:hypothetical protein DL96DRAFT_1710202 [Flagelloscypha sp. PMI_526]
MSPSASTIYTHETQPLDNLIIQWLRNLTPLEWNALRIQGHDTWNLPNTRSSSSKSPIRPPRPRNAFFIFRAIYCHALHLFPRSDRDGKPHKQQKETSKAASRLWKLLDDDLVKIFDVQAEIEKLEHGEKFPGYRYKTARTRPKARSFPTPEAKPLKLHSIQSLETTAAQEATSPTWNEDVSTSSPESLLPANDVHERMSQWSPPSCSLDLDILPSSQNTCLNLDLAYNPFTPEDLWFPDFRLDTMQPMYGWVEQGTIDHDPYFDQRTPLFSQQETTFY